MYCCLLCVCAARRGQQARAWCVTAGVRLKPDKRGGARMAKYCISLTCSCCRCIGACGVWKSWVAKSGRRNLFPDSTVLKGRIRA